MEPTHSTLSAALAAAQGELRDPAKDAKNPHYGSSYADLAGFVQAARAALPKHGISYSQGFSIRDGGMWFSTTLRFAGEVLDVGALPVTTAIPADPQKLGSLVTYLRRYSLGSALGLAGDDDDGNAAAGVGGAPAKPAGVQRATAKAKAPEPKPAPTASAELRDRLRTMGEPIDAPSALIAWVTTDEHGDPQLGTYAKVAESEDSCRWVLEGIDGALVDLGSAQAVKEAVASWVEARRAARAARGSS